MSLQINRNFAAISAGALTSYHANQTTMGKAITRVSTGKRVNTAADDVSAYMSSHRLKSDADAYNALQKGIQNGSSYLNAADKAMTSIIDTLTAMREKALEYANAEGTTEKDVLKAEFNALYDAAKSAVSMKIGNKENLLTQGATFNFEVGLQYGDAVDVSNAPTDIKTLTIGNYTSKDADASKVSFAYSDANLNSTTFMIGSDSSTGMFRLSSEASVITASDVAKHGISGINALFGGSGTTMSGTQVATYTSEGSRITITWDKSKVTDTNITNVTEVTLPSSSTPTNVGTDAFTALSFDGSTGTINFGATTLDIQSDGNVYGTIGKNGDNHYSDVTLGTSAAKSNSTMVGSWKVADSTGTLQITWNNDAADLLYAGTESMIAGSGVFLGSTAFATSTTFSTTLVKDVQYSGSGGDYTFKEAHLDYTGKSGSLTVADQYDSETKYTLDKDGRIYKSGDKTALGEWSSDSSSGITLKWGDHDQNTSFSVKWDGIKDALYNTDGTSFSLNGNGDEIAKKLATSIDTITKQQAQIGGGINALEYISTHISNMADVEEQAYTNLTEADMAKEMTSYVKSNIYAQAAQTMIAQANQSLAQVLNLLQ